MEPKFYNANGTLTAYSFSCGSVDRKVSIKTGNYKEMYMEHTHYHVRSGKKGLPWSTWETFSHNELTKARKYFRSINVHKEIKNNGNYKKN